MDERDIAAKDEYTNVLGGDEPSGEFAQVLQHFEILVSHFNLCFYSHVDVTKDPPEFEPLASPDMATARLLVAGLPIDRRYPDCTTKIKPVSIDGVHGDWVVAKGANPARRTLYIHGGGFSFGNVATYRSFMAHLSQATECAVLGVDYRLAPEYPFPAGLEDNLSAYDYLFRNGIGGLEEADKIFIVGDSAGGNLALSVSLKLRDVGARMCDAVVAISPVTDLNLTAPSLTEMERAGGRQMYAAYAGLAGLDDPLVSPLNADYSNFPPLLLQVGGAEGLLADSTRLAACAHQSGVEVTLEIWRHMIHVHQVMAPMLPEAVAAIEHIGRFLRKF